MRAIVGFLIEAHGTKCEETLLNSSRPSCSDPCSNAPLRSFRQTPGPKRWLLDLRSVADVHAEQWPLWGKKSLPGATAERPLLYRGQCQARPDDRMLSPFCALANDATRGSRFSSRSAGSHLMMG